MKKILSVIRTAVFCVSFLGLGGQSGAQAQSLEKAAPPIRPTAPPVGGINVSASGTAKFRHIDRSEFPLPHPRLSNGNISNTVTPLFLPEKTSPSWALAAANAIADALAGSLKSNTDVSYPTNYASCLGHVNWFNMAFSATTTLWKDKLSPLAPFDQELGQIVWVLVDMQTVDGSDGVSLSGSVVDASSNDGGYLNGEVTFSGTAYTSLAPLVKADGTEVTSGPATQMGKRLLVLVQLPAFDSQGTQTGLDGIRNWVQSYVPYTIDYSASEGGTTSYATVSTSTTSPFVFSAPTAVISQTGVGVLNGLSKQTYQVYSSWNPNGPWVWYDQVTGTNLSEFPAGQTNPAQFFRVARQ